MILILSVLMVFRLLLEYFISNINIQMNELKKMIYENLRGTKRPSSKVLGRTNSYDI
jgi:hypothetical protein